VDLAASVGISLTGDELFTAPNALNALLETDETPDLHLALGLAVFLANDLPSAELHLRTAYLEFGRQKRNRRASLAAGHLGRLEHSGHANSIVAAGWFARGLRLLEGDEECVERGWLALGILGCSNPSAAELESNSTLALRLARRFDDRDLECRALADSGLALVSQGRCAEGMRLIDEAMTMVRSGECANLFITGQVECSFVAACQRAGDLARLESWLTRAVVEQAPVLGRQAPPNVMLSHCRREYGLLLCQAGRWSEAERALRDTVEGSRGLPAASYNDARVALADLRLSQGRVAEASVLIQDLSGYPDAQLQIGRLHVARGEHDLAVGVLRQAVRDFAGDRVRGAALLDVLVTAEIARGDLTAARDAVDELGAYAAAAGQPGLHATAALATARLARAEGRTADARHALEGGLRVVAGGHRPLVAAELHLALAELCVESDPALARAEARRAMDVFGPIGAPQRFAAQRVLAALGTPAPSPAMDDQLAALTPREREILPLLAQGLSNPEIAAHLVISTKTAEHHVGSILRKLHLRRRGEAAAFAVGLGT
jgi:ATP/maltotriose-dependent transcriptional regulator MalT